MTTTPEDKDPLDAMFQAARAYPLVPDADVIDTVLKSAHEVQDMPRAAHAPRKRAGRHGALLGWLRPLGGWPAAAGLTLATCAGLWIGVMMPEPMTRTTPGIFAQTSLDLFADPALGTQDLVISASFGLIEEGM